MFDARFSFTSQRIEDGFRLGELRVEPATGEIAGPAGREQVDPKVMAVLVTLARRAVEPAMPDRVHPLLPSWSLWRSAGLFIARTSSFAFKDSDYGIERISSLRGVNCLLQGSVREEGDDVRIAAQLVDASGVQLWNETFDRKLSGIFEIHDDIARAVASSVVPRVSPPIADQRLPDIEAYQHYLLGREILHSQIPNFDNLAAEEFRKALAIDPDFAKAYADLAIALIWARDREWHLRDQPTKIRKQAEADLLISRALELNPDLARAHAAKGMLHKVRGQLAEAEASLRKALALDPNMAHAGAVLVQVWGDWHKGKSWELLQRMARLDPLEPAANPGLRVSTPNGVITRARNTPISVCLSPKRRRAAPDYFLQPRKTVLTNLRSMRKWSA